MSTFSDPLRLDDLGNRTFRLVLPLRYSFDNKVIEAPAGFITDFASVPRLFWTILPPYGPYGKAAVIHDALYRTDGFNGQFTRKQADDFFLDGMKITGVSWVTRYTMYKAVRMFSARYWDTPKDVKARLLMVRLEEINELDHDRHFTPLSLDMKNEPEIISVDSGEK